MFRNADDAHDPRGRRDTLRGSRGGAPAPARPGRRDEGREGRRDEPRRDRDEGSRRPPRDPRAADGAPVKTVERGMYGQVIGVSSGEDDDDEGPEIPEAPVRRLLSLFIAGFAALLGLGLIFGAQTAGVGPARYPYAVVIFGVQVLFVLAWTMAVRPPGPREVAVVGLLAAAAADLAAVVPGSASLSPILLIAVIGFVVGVVAQLWRREARMRTTEALGSTLVIMIGVVAFTTLVMITRIPLGTQSIVICLGATGTALLVARLMDTVAPWPRIALQVPRGWLGVVAGAMVGTAGAAFLGGYISGFTPHTGAYAGAAAAVAAIIADLGVGFAEAGRELEGEPPTMWLSRHMQGPLGGFALAAPVAYAVSLLVPLN